MTVPLPRAVMVEVTVGGRSYRFASPPEQEQRLRALAARVDALLNNMRGAEPHADRDRHMLLACLTLASDIADANDKLDAQVSAVTQFHRQLTERLSVLLNA